MADQTRTSPIPELARRRTLGLAAAVATFGAALGMNVTAAQGETSQQQYKYRNSQYKENSSQYKAGSSQYKAGSSQFKAGTTR